MTETNQQFMKSRQERGSQFAELPEEDQLAEQAAIRTEALRNEQNDPLSRRVKNEVMQMDNHTLALAEQYRAMTPPDTRYMSPADAQEKRDEFNKQREEVFAQLELAKLRRRWLARKEYKMPQQNGNPVEQTMTDLQTQIDAVRALAQRTAYYCPSKEQILNYLHTLEEAQAQIAAQLPPNIYQN